MFLQGILLFSSTLLALTFLGLGARKLQLLFTFLKRWHMGDKDETWNSICVKRWEKEWPDFALDISVRGANITAGEAWAFKKRLLNLPPGEDLAVYYREFSTSHFLTTEASWKRPRQLGDLKKRVEFSSPALSRRMDYGQDTFAYARGTYRGFNVMGDTSQGLRRWEPYTSSPIYDAVGNFKLLNKVIFESSIKPCSVVTKQKLFYLTKVSHIIEANPARMSSLDVLYFQHFCDWVFLDGTYGVMILISGF